jgi:hypothetical protein
MAATADPHEALLLFQQALSRREIPLQLGTVDRELYCCIDYPDGKARLSYMRIEGETLTALVMLVENGSIEGKPCFQIGYAVPEAYRNHGRAKGAVKAAIADLQYELSRVMVSEFYVEAFVPTDNTASLGVAGAAISTSPVAVTDRVSGLPAFRYVRKIESKADALVPPDN